MSLPVLASLTPLSGASLGGCPAYVAADLPMLVESDVLGLKDAQVVSLSHQRDV